jgi:3-oxoadipate enol-lactonase
MADPAGKRDEPGPHEGDEAAGSADDGGPASSAPDTPDTPDTATVTAPPGWPEGIRMHLPGRGDTTVYASHPLEDYAGPGDPVVVLLHGWMATAGLNWFTSLPLLAEHFRVLALDHRGHGRGIRADRRFRLADCADDVFVLVDELGIDQCVPVGYSMGGPVAQLLWKRHPEQVAGLVLCATSRNFQGSPRERAVVGAMSGLARAAVRVTPTSWQHAVGHRFSARRFDDTELGRWARHEISGNEPRALIEAGTAIAAFNSRPWAGEIDVPTAVVVTLRDGVVPPKRQLALAEAIDGATVHPVDGDHLACAWVPEQFVPILVRACRQVTADVDADEPGRAAS